MENKEILNNQFKWLNMLQANSKKPILIKALEGKTPNELKNSNAAGLYQWSYFKDVFHMIQVPYFTRSILVNEMVLDPDTQTWDDLKKEMDKIIITGKKLSIPYLLAYSGGKGCHFHVFFDTNINIPEELLNKAKENNFDVYKAIRLHVFNYIIKESGANINLLKIDKPKINWQISTMGSQVRDFGTPRSGGFYKTLIDEVPANRPLSPLPLLFPDKVEYWKIPDDHISSIINQIKTGIVKQIKYNKQALPGNHGIRQADELPCIALIMNGLDAGRYYGAGAIALASKDIGLPWIDIEPKVELFLSRCKGLTSSDIILRVENSKHLYDSDKVFSCKWVKENLKCPKPSECIITLKRKEQKEKTDDEDNGHLKIADAIFATNNFLTLIETDEIMKYKEGIYEKYGDNFIKAEAQKINEEISTHTVNEIVNYVKRKSYTPVKEINTKKFLVALKNGCYNLDTHKLEPHNHTNLLTIKVPIVYNPELKCPAIDKFLSEIMSADDIPAVEEFFGYCLFRDYPIQKAFMLVGDGGNGKSTLITLLKHFLGETNVCSVALQELEENHFAAANLFGKLANMYADLPPQALDSTGKIKMLTGGDHITVERKFGGFFEYVNYAKMIFSTNKMPMSYDDTDAFYRRWVILTFPNKFNENSGKGLLEKITTESELSGFFNKALVGVKRLLDNGKFSSQKSIEEIREQYVRLSDSIQAFVMDCLDISPDEWIEKKTLYEIYGAYCKSKNIPISSDNRFFKRIRFNIKVEDQKITNEDKKRVYVFKGISFKIDTNSFYSNYTPSSMSSMSKMSTICIEESIDNIVGVKEVGKLEHKGETLGHLNHEGQIQTKIKEFENLKLTSINSSNLVEFCLWFCSQDKNYTPSEIKAVVEKICSITPKPAQQGITVEVMGEVSEAVIE